MALRRSRAKVQAHESESENYFISMTDIMVGMTFMFIIMLMFFAVKLERIAAKGAEVIKSFTTTEEIRAKILNDIRDDLAKKGFAVQVYPDKGILRLPESILFDKGKANLLPRGKESIGILGQSLYNNLICYTSYIPERTARSCPEMVHSVEAVLIEGHTDSDGSDLANWNLSIQRSFTAYQFMIESNPALVGLANKNNEAILSISGYGSQRPVEPNNTEDNKRNNRRVDIRIIMVPPKSTGMRM
jgi:flagellar motor protein MotB